jgi:hypothetical protein
MSTTRVPFSLCWGEDVPIDISFVFEHERPAGKHGFVRVDGDRLAFADGVEARFWGTNFNSGANFPSYEYAETTARRLAKFGVNIVRTHQMDAEWATPNIFQANRARPKDHTRTLDPDSLDRLDYLIYCLKREGIYLYLDLLTYRQFRPGDLVESVDGLPQAAKPYLYFDRRLIALQKEFNEALWTHVNPYTGLAYCDDPAIALSELVNESDFFANPVLLEPYRTRLERQYTAWVEEQSLSRPALPVDFRSPDAQLARFLVELMRDYYREMIGHLRSIGVKIPINGANWSINLGVAAAQDVVDFSDSHTYWNFPLWESSGTATLPMVKAYRNTFADLSLMRLANKPFFVSEWDHAWPDEWRAESPLVYAAVAAFQGWSGLAIHTYRYSTWQAEDRLGGGAETINGVTYRNHFDAGNDPAKFGLWHHAALLLRRGDVRRADETLTVWLENDPQEWLLDKPSHVAALAATPERYRLTISLPQDRDTDAHTIWATYGAVIDEDEGEVASDTGELWRSWRRGYGWIDTPRTKAAYGFLGDVGPIKLRGLDLDVKTDFAAIALSSLTDEPLERSDSILLTAVGRCDNTDAAYDENHTRQLNFGRAPVLIEPIAAVVRLATERANLKVLVISQHGELVTKLPTRYADGVLSFEIGPQPTWNPSTIYYLIRV